MKNLVFLIFFFLTSISLFAQETWTGAESSVWDDDDNWDGGVPNNNDDIIIDAGSYFFPPIITSATADEFDPDKIIIRNGGVLTMTGGNLEIDEDVEILSSGRFNFEGGTIDIGNDLEIKAGIFDISGGTLNIEDDIDIENGGSYNQSGGTVNLDDELIVGINGNSSAGGNSISISGGQFNGDDDVEIYSDNNTFDFSGDADINIDSDFDFNDTEGTTIDVSGNATLDVNDFVEFNDTTSNTFEISGTSQVTINESDGNDQQIAQDYFTVTEGGYLSLGDFVFLPVELIEFKGQIEDDKVVFNWSTASEKNNDYFEILKSEDGITFSAIGKISGNGTSNLVNHYDYVDQHPKYGINYYQLRQVDYDGKNEFFSVILAIYGSSRELVSHMVVWPNPVTERRFNVVIDNYQITGIPTISLIDLQGGVLLKESFSPNSNSISIDASGTRINSGIYILEYYNGLVRIRKRIVMN
ncbi:MAG: hypothetical protein ACJA2S_001790 [Cyclobacteriaceae bacterium]|jgi:hypothetical protein